MCRISVIIATHNRADFVQLALVSLARQTLDPSEFEVIVVDNASTDHTSRIVKGMQKRMLNLRYISEARIGLSCARNAGLLAAKAPLVAYLDDDATAQPDWLCSVLTAFKDSPSSACVAGPVHLNWNGLPQTVPSQYWSLLSHVDYGEADRPLRENEHIVGANMAFRADLLREVGMFSTDLGRKGKQLLSGEESEVIAKIRANGYSVFYAATAKVFHIVHPERTRKSWLWQRVFWDGASQPVLDGSKLRGRRECALQAYRDVKRVVLFLLQTAAAGFLLDRQRCLDSALNVTRRVGRLRTHLLMLAGVA